MELLRDTVLGLFDVREKNIMDIFLLGGKKFLSSTRCRLEFESGVASYRQE